jgi:hypothetical protein
MKKYALLICTAVMCMFLFSCSGSYESQANDAYNQSKHAQGYDKKILEKRAYIFYQKAMKETSRRNLSLTFKQHFLEITLNRADMVLSAGAYDMDAIHLFMEDLDSTIDKETPNEIKVRYANFLSAMADSCLGRGLVNDAIKWLTKAGTVGDNPAPYETKKNQITADFSKQYMGMAEDAFNQSKADKNPELAIKAEYYVLLAMVFDPKVKGGEQLLSDVRKANINTYSGYAKVVEGKLDKRVNKFDILLAVAKTKSGMTVCMFNNSYNPQRLKSENFYLVDLKGQKYKAAASSKIEPEILDTQHETKTIKLSFPGAPAPANVKKLVYENGEHYSEKLFF